MATQTERLDLLRAELRERGRVNTAEASERLGVTPLTLRRDIIALEAEGTAIRVHGGAIAPTSRSFEPPLAERLRSNSELKAAMAAKAMQHIRPGMNVALDFGTRILAFAQELRQHPLSLVIAPSSLESARILGADPHFRVMIPGGFVGPGDFNIYGSETEAFFSRHRWDLCVLTAAGVDADSLLLTDLKPEYAAIKRAMYESSDAALILAEPRHIGTRSFAPIATARPGDVLITSDHSPAEALRTLANSGLRVETVPDLPED